MLNFATIGNGFITEEFRNTAPRLSEYSLAAVHSRSMEKAKAAALKYGADTAYDDLNAMAADKTIDCVYIASPNSLHAEQSALFLKAGKHVLCEKPLCSNAAETRALCSLAEKSGCILMEAYKTAYMPAMSIIKANLCRLGKIRSVFFSFAKYSSRYDAHKAGGDVNTFRAEFSNGGMLDLGVYCLYPMLMLFGRPEKVASTAIKIPGGVDGVGFASLDYGDFAACIHYSKISDSFLPCEIAGEEGTMTIDRMNLPGSVTIKPRGAEPEQIAVPDCTEGGMVYEIEAFISAVASVKAGADPKSVGLMFPHSFSITGAEICDEIRRQNDISYPADGKYFDRNER